MKLSVIIPVYNVERTLSDCLDSVLEQSYADCELILVDDCSTDNSFNICKTYAEREPGIILKHHEQNRGLSEARNTGIASARGDYITFVDSDDKLAPETWTSLMAILDLHPDYDILEYPVSELVEDGNSKHLMRLPCGVYDDMDNYWLVAKAYVHCYACNKIYRKALFREVKYPSGQVFEDAATLPLLLRQCRKVAITDRGSYLYRDNPNGLTAQAGGRELAYLLSIHSLMFRNQWAAHGHQSHYRQPLKDYYSYILNIALDVHHLTGTVPDVPDVPLSGTIKLNLKRLIGLKRLCQIHRMFKKTS